MMRVLFVFVLLNVTAAAIVYGLGKVYLMVDPQQAYAPAGALVIGLTSIMAAVGVGMLAIRAGR